MSVLGPLGPWWVAKVLLAVVLLGVATALVVRIKGHPFLPWLVYGVSLPVVALPHAIGVVARRDEPVLRAAGFFERRLALRPHTVAVVAVLAVINLVLVNFHRQLFGAAWQYVMWEGGVFEGLTPLNFLLGAVVFLLAARAVRDDPVRRRWLAR